MCPPPPPPLSEQSSLRPCKVKNYLDPDRVVVEEVSFVFLLVPSAPITTVDHFQFSIDLIFIAKQNYSTLQSTMDSFFSLRV